MSRKKGKKKRTAAQRRWRKRRREEYEMIFISGKQKWVRKPPTIDGMDVDEFIRRNADPIFLVQNEMWEELHEWEQREARAAGHHLPRHDVSIDLDSYTEAEVEQIGDEIDGFQAQLREAGIDDRLEFQACGRQVDFEFEPSRRARRYERQLLLLNQLREPDELAAAEEDVEVEPLFETVISGDAGDSNALEEPDELVEADDYADVTAWFEGEADAL